jgi:3-hydroxyisobutyrate dehydrogenase
VLDAERGVLAGLAPGGLIIEMTTSTPSLAIEIARACEVRGSAALDAPVSGGDVGAKAATLSIMVGGDAHAFERATPLLALLGKSISRMGGPGAGQHTKLCNQILACSNMVGVCESLLYAQRAGLDAAAVAQAIGAGAAGSWAMTNLGDKVVQRDVRPGFMIAHMVKDLRIALDEARALGLQLPGLANAERLYAQLLAQGHGRDGTQALVLALEALVAEDAAQRK